MADQQTSWDQEEALTRLSKLHQLAREVRQAEAEEAEARTLLHEKVQSRREKKARLDSWIESDTRPLPLFDPTGPATGEAPPEVLGLEEMLATVADQDAEEAQEQPPNHGHAQGQDLGEVEVCPGVSFRLTHRDDGTFRGHARAEGFGNWDRRTLPPGVPYWPDDRILSGVATQKAGRALALVEHVMLYDGRLELDFFAVAGGEGIPLPGPEPGDDRTALWEKVYLWYRQRGIAESISDRNLRLALCDWRRRQAEGDVEPRWDRWSEFRVSLADGSVVECLLLTHMAFLQLEAYSPLISPSDHHSFRVAGPQPVSPIEYATRRAQEEADHLANGGKPKGRKGRKKGARS